MRPNVCSMGSLPFIFVGQMCDEPPYHHHTENSIFNFNVTWGWTNFRSKFMQQFSGILKRSWKWVLVKGRSGLFVVISETLMLFITVTQNPLNAFSFFPPLKNNGGGIDVWSFCALGIQSNPFSFTRRWLFEKLNLVSSWESFNQSLVTTFNQRTHLKEDEVLIKTLAEIWVKRLNN